MNSYADKLTKIAIMMPIIAPADKPSWGDISTVVGSEVIVPLVKVSTVVELSIWERFEWNNRKKALGRK